MKTYLTYDDVAISPTYSTVLTRKNVDLTSKLTKDLSIKFPIISAPMDSVTGLEMAQLMNFWGGLGCLHRFMSIEDQVKIINAYFEGDFKIFPDRNIIISVGVTGDYFERFEASYEAGARVFCLDVAHGHHLLLETALKKIKSKFPLAQIIAGNIATPEAALTLYAWGADVLRVGISAGSLCETRVRTGVGLPMITCLMDIKNALDENGVDIPIIADGGIKTPGDICKAIVAGADTVMIGSILAGCRETPGEIVSIVKNWPYEEKFKRYRGSASSESKKLRGEQSKNIEGNSTLIPYKGKGYRILNDIEDGLRSSMSYVGAHTIEEFKRNGKLVQITNAGAIEATPHLIK